MFGLMLKSTHRKKMAEMQEMQRFLEDRIEDQGLLRTEMGSLRDKAQNTNKEITRMTALLNKHGIGLYG